jgi:N-acyl-D-aspartate/D-glutamate deacylase
VLERGFDLLFVQFFTTVDNDDTIEAAMRRPNTVMTFSDAGAHVSQVCDGSLATYLLGYWVRQRQRFTLPEAVRMVSSVPAAAWGFADRGLLRPGFVADVNVFDPARVAPAVPEVVDDLPGGAARLRQGSEGFLATVIAGEPVIEHGDHTGALPGRLLRRRG